MTVTSLYVMFFFSCIFFFQAARAVAGYLMQTTWSRRVRLSHGVVDRERVSEFECDEASSKGSVCVDPEECKRPKENVVELWANAIEIRK